MVPMGTEKAMCDDLDGVSLKRREGEFINEEKSSPADDNLNPCLPIMSIRQ